MGNVKNTALVLVVFLLLSHGALADELLVGRGTHEVDGSASMSIVRANGLTAFSLGVGYGYFVMDFLEVGIGTQVSFGDGFDSETAFPNVTVYYNRGQKILPFIGFGAGVTSVSTANTVRSTAFLLVPAVGILVPLNKHAGLSASFVYLKAFSSGRSSNSFVVSPVGLSLFF